MLFCLLYSFSIIYHLVIVNIISNTPRAIILSHRTCLVGHFCVYAWGLKPWFTITSRRRQGKNFWIARIILVDTKIGLKNDFKTYKTRARSTELLFLCVLSKNCLLQILYDLIFLIFIYDFDQSEATADRQLVTNAIKGS